MVAITYIVLAVAGALFGFRFGGGSVARQLGHRRRQDDRVGMSATIINTVDRVLPNPLKSGRYELCTANSLPEEACIEVEIIGG